MGMKYNYIYKTTCLCGSLNGHYYIGKHTTENLNDKYAGSGIAIRDYFKKYGKKEGETYTIEIIEYNDTPEINADREKEIIGNLWIEDPMCMNLMEGGKSSGMKGKKHSEEWKAKIKGKLAKENNPWFGKHPNEEQRKRLSDAHLGQIPWNKGIKISEEHKRKISTAKSGSKTSKAKGIIQYDLDGNRIKEWHSSVIIQREMGYNASNIINCCNGKLLKAYGYIWRYAA